MKKSLKCLSLIIVLLMCFVMVGCTKENKEAEKLVTPTNVVVSEAYVISWDEVANASKYSILVGSKTLTTTQCSYDISNELVEGTNSIWVFAVGDGTNYTDSAAFNLVVIYTKITEQAFVETIAAQYKGLIGNPNDFETEKEYDDYCLSVASDQAEMLIEISTGLNLTKEELLDINLILYTLMSDIALEPTNLTLLAMLHEKGISNNTYATLIYNYLIRTLENIDTTGENANLAMVVYLIKGNDKAVISTLEVIVEYVNNVFGDLSSFVGSAEQYTEYEAYLLLVEILLGEENRIVASDFDAGTTAIYKILASLIGAVPSTEKGAKEALIVIREIIKLGVGAADPVNEIIYKFLTAISLEDYNTLKPSLENIINILGNGLTSTIIVDLSTELQTISTTLKGIIDSIDLTVEIASIKTALENFKSGEGMNAILEIIAMQTGQNKAELEAILGQIETVIAEYDSETMTPTDLLTNILAIFDLTIEEMIIKIIDTVLETALTQISSNATPEQIEQCKTSLTQVANILSEFIESAGETFTIQEILDLIEEKMQIDLEMPDSIDLTKEYDITTVQTILTKINQFIENLSIANEPLETPII